MNWFRFYHNALHDPKVQALRGDLFKFWVNLLCVASLQDDRGTIPTDEELAIIMKVRRDHIGRFMDALRACKLVDTDAKGVRKPHNWDDRQPPSDNHAERQKRYREKVSDKSNNGDVTRHVAPHVTSPLPLACAVDTELEGELEEDPPNPPPSGGSENGARALGSILGSKPPDPAEVRRVADAVDALFPTSHFGAKVGQFALMYSPAWILKACESAAGSGKSVGWSYIHGILKRWQLQGGPDPPATLGRGSGHPGVKPAALPPSVEQVRRERAERDRNRKPVETTPEDIAKWKRWAEGSDATLKKFAEKCLADHN